MTTLALYHAMTHCTRTHLGTWTFAIVYYNLSHNLILSSLAAVSVRAHHIHRIRSLL
ncbi:hypothetical protein BD311DRAFT_758109 [Dichomitus squalens]|uniref:Uncharacterized protein n=1 Tax=Dichomitus squalens TaxID=114155 RepID=A0A4Q9MR33_9APHY|nr:hypothetical protein BD311DRAFT_758109 [Dichomitus squalens]